MNKQPRSLEIDRKLTFALFSLLSGVLSLLFLVVHLQPQLYTAKPLPFFVSNQAGYIILAIVALFWSTFSIPFVVALGTLLRTKSSSLALAATILSSAGILLLGFARYIYVGALLSIVASGNVAPGPAEAIYQASIWANLQFLLGDPPFMAWGLGQLLFGWLAWKSKVLPNWLSVLGTIGGIAGLLTSLLLPSNAIPLALFDVGSFSVWGFTTGILLLRSRRH